MNEEDNGFHVCDLPAGTVLTEALQKAIVSEFIRNHEMTGDYAIPQARVNHIIAEFQPQPDLP